MKTPCAVAKQSNFDTFGIACLNLGYVTQGRWPRKCQCEIWLRSSGLVKYTTNDRCQECGLPAGYDRLDGYSGLSKWCLREPTNGWLWAERLSHVKSISREPEKTVRLRCRSVTGYSRTRGRHDLAWQLHRRPAACKSLVAVGIHAGARPDQRASTITSHAETIQTLMVYRRGHVSKSASDRIAFCIHV